MKAALEGCLANIENYIKIHASAAAGNPVSSHRYLQSYSQAIKALDYKIIHGLGKVIFYSDIRSQYDDKRESMSFGTEVIGNCIGTLKKSKLASHIRNMFAGLK